MPNSIAGEMAFKDRGPIFQNLELLSERIAILETTAERMEGMFSPVLRPKEAEPPSGIDPQTDCPFSDVASRLEEAVQRLMRLDAALCELEKRCQL